jgi:hypothetical protein
MGLGHLVAGIVGSNPSSGMDVCPHPSMLCCPVCNQSDWKNRKNRKRGKRKIKKERKDKRKVDSVYAYGVGDTGSVPK